MKKCDRCGIREATIILTDVWQERLCDRCFNQVVSDEIGVKLESMPKEIEVTDNLKLEGSLRSNSDFIQMAYSWRLLRILNMDTSLLCMVS